MKTQAVLFDCDGTLVDTETLCAKSDIEILAGYGIHFTGTDDFLNQFLGRAHPDILVELNARYGKNIVLDDWAPAFIRKSLARIPTEMVVYPESVAFVHRLADMGIKLAVGSNGFRELVTYELEVAGYTDVIADEYIFALQDVPSPKPAPDLFLKAAAALGVDPQACIVVEDSAAGARGGVAAGMRVIGYTGFSHDVERSVSALESAGCVHIISDLRDLEALL